MGSTYGGHNLIILMREEVGGKRVKLKTTSSRAISGSLEVRAVEAQAHLGNLSPVRDLVCCQGKRTVIHWGIYPVGMGIYPW